MWYVVVLQSSICCGFVRHHIVVNGIRLPFLKRFIDPCSTDTHLGRHGGSFEVSSKELMSRVELPASKPVASSRAATVGKSAAKPMPKPGTKHVPKPQAKTAGKGKGSGPQGRGAIKSPGRGPAAKAIPPNQGKGSPSWALPLEVRSKICGEIDLLPEESPREPPRGPRDRPDHNPLASGLSSAKDDGRRPSDYDPSTRHHQSSMGYDWQSSRPDQRSPRSLMDWPTSNKSSLPPPHVPSSQAPAKTESHAQFLPSPSSSQGGPNHAHPSSHARLTPHTAPPSHMSTTSNVTPPHSSRAVVTQHTMASHAPSTLATSFTGNDFNTDGSTDSRGSLDQAHTNASIYTQAPPHGPNHAHELSRAQTQPQSSLPTQAHGSMHQPRALGPLDKPPSQTPSFNQTSPRVGAYFGVPNGPKVHPPPHPEAGQLLDGSPTVSPTSDSAHSFKKPSYQSPQAEDHMNVDAVSGRFGGRSPYSFPQEFQGSDHLLVTSEKDAMNPQDKSPIFQEYLEQQISPVSATPRQFEPSASSTASRNPEAWHQPPPIPIPPIVRDRPQHQTQHDFMPTDGTIHSTSTTSSTKTNLAMKALVRPPQLDLPLHFDDEFAVVSPTTKGQIKCPNKRNVHHQCTFFCLRWNQPQRRPMILDDEICVWPVPLVGGGGRSAPGTPRTPGSDGREKKTVRFSGQDRVKLIPPNPDVPREDHLLPTTVQQPFHPQPHVPIQRDPYHPPMHTEEDGGFHPRQHPHHSQSLNDAHYPEPRYPSREVMEDRNISPQPFTRENGPWEASKSNPLHVEGRDGGVFGHQALPYDVDSSSVSRPPEYQPRYPSLHFSTP